MLVKNAVQQKQAKYFLWRGGESIPLLPSTSPPTGFYLSFSGTYFRHAVGFGVSCYALLINRDRKRSHEWKFTKVRAKQVSPCDVNMGQISRKNHTYVRDPACRILLL